MDEDADPDFEEMVVASVSFSVHQLVTQDQGALEELFVHVDKIWV